MVTTITQVLADLTMATECFKSELHHRVRKHETDVYHNIHKLDT